MSLTKEILRKMEIAFFTSPVSIIFAKIMNKYAIHLYKDVVSYLKPYLDSGILLDIGTGPGILLLEFAKENKNLKLIGIDISSYLLNYAKKNCLKENYEKIQFLLQNAHSLGFKDESIDYIISGSSICFWKNPIRVLNEIYRVLKLKGKAYIYDEDRVKSLKDIKTAIFKQKILGFGLPAYSYEEIENFIQRSHFQKYNFKRNGMIIRFELIK